MLSSGVKEPLCLSTLVATRSVLHTRMCAFIQAHTQLSPCPRVHPPTHTHTQPSPQKLPPESPDNCHNVTAASFQALFFAWALFLDAQAALLLEKEPLAGARGVRCGFVPYSQASPPTPTASASAAPLFSFHIAHECQLSDLSSATRPTHTDTHEPDAWWRQMGCETGGVWED